MDRLRVFNPYGVVFKVLDEVGDYIKIESADEIFRVRAETLKLIKPEKNWLFEIGDTVSISGQEYTGIVARVDWHQKT